MKWSLKEPVLGIVNASGQLVIYKYTEESQSFSILCTTEISQGKDYVVYCKR